MQPGILDSQLKLAPVRRVSPSRYAELRACALRGVWSAGHQPDLLPVSPAARLGSVIHRILEEASAGHLAPGDQPAIAKRWKELCAATEQGMLASWLERCFVPLRASVSDFEVRRIRACARASDLAQHALRGTSGTHANHPGAAVEFWVQSRDGLVGGFIDQVEMSSEGPVLADYKSGGVFEAGPGGILGHVRAGYEIQLRLYAALYAITTGQWPVRLELVALDGSRVPVAFDQQGCLDLLNDAVARLSQINAVIVSLAAAPTAVERQLASPGEANCRYCPFRPRCWTYQEMLATVTAGIWPDDLVGTIKKIRRLGNSKIAIEIETDGPIGTVHRVIGLSPDPARHPALSALQQGDRAGLYNLRSNRKAHTFEESAATVIYKMVS